MTTQLTYIGNHRQLAVDDMLHFDQYAPNFVAFIEAIAGAAQDIEDSAYDLLSSTGINEATGPLLDRLGRIVGERRGGLDDEAYRGFVRIRIRANLSMSVRDELIAIFRDAAGAQSVRYFDLYPAAFAIMADRIDPMSERVRVRVGALIREIKAGGVWVSMYEVNADTFIFDDGPGFDVGLFAELI